MTAPEPPALRRLSADERRELRAALSSRRARLYEAPAAGLATAKAVEGPLGILDRLLADVELIRVEVPR